MSDKQQTPYEELSYYGLSLLSHLRGSHPELAADRSFIAERADRAAEAYSDAIRAGSTHAEAERPQARSCTAGFISRLTIRWSIFFGTSSPRRFPKRPHARSHYGC